MPLFVGCSETRLRRINHLQADSDTSVGKELVFGTHCALNCAPAKRLFFSLFLGLTLFRTGRFLPESPKVPKGLVPLHFS
jgi:hypothetical protein